ncbi:phospholipid-transporting ATPase ABCA7 [Tachyglossus aculeatus]|uniref:phospholipid-transporting ATPase ABCA7 n=1 Tax=Tachyglossus aculeatus TaxID=9261 RepID=UPI0018F35627|nr:phospholipid-transporting ATPase ABCA7 [Tachyglossus aculeatus]
MSFQTQLMLLLWKNFTYRKRQPVQLVIELLWPLFLFLILVAVRQSYPPFEHHECHFPNKPLPSAGSLPWLQGIICNMRNPCFHYPTPGETPGVVDNFNGSLVSRLLADSWAMLSSPNTREVLHSFQILMPILQQLQRGALPLQHHLRLDENFSRFLQENTSLPPVLAQELLGTPLSLRGLPRGVPLEELVCNASLLTSQLAASERLQRALCALPPDQLQGLHSSFLTQLDPGKMISMAMLQMEPGQRKKALEATGSFLLAAEALLKELSSLTSLTELQQVLQGDLGASRSLEAVSQVLCERSEKGGLGVPSLDWYEDSDLKVMLGQNDPKPLVPPDNRTSPYCRKLFGELEANSISRLLWQRLKPLVIGKILYTPATPITRRIMAEVNQTFQELALLGKLPDVWAELGPQLFAFMNGSAEVVLLQSLLQSPALQLLVKNDSAIHRFLAGGLYQGYNWRQSFADMEQLMDSVGHFMECISLDKLEEVESEGQLVNRALQLLGERRFWAGLVFVGTQDWRPNSPGHLQIKIRMDIDDVTRTNKIKNRLWAPGPAADPFSDLRYVSGGFVYLQDMVEGAVRRLLNGSSHHTRLYLQQMPYPCYVDDVFLRVLNRSLPLFLTLAWIYSVALTIKAVVREKEERLRETMRAMGLSRAVLWFSWFLSSLLPFLVSAGFLVLVLKLGDILPYSDSAVIFLFLATFAMATISQSFLISTFFSRANLAAACGGLAYFTLYLPYVLCVAWREQLSPTVRLIAGLLSPVAFGFGCEYFSLYEEQGLGVQWHNFGASPVEGDPFNLALAGGLLFLDAVLYGLATWYLEAVWPGQYGIPEPWDFPFRASYWCGKWTVPESQQAPAPDSGDPQVLLEEPPEGLQPGVSLRGLEKRYAGSASPALRGLTLDFYEGHITAFLGHNGAGKTTTLSILSGLFPPTAGSAFILGQNICSNMAAVRHLLGLCPQHNVLFDILTVEEHIWFYGRLKGLSAKGAQKELEPLLQDVGLSQKRHEQTRHLSGGMQRKLSVAIAFVGGSRVVILDEPTAGVDAFSRRGIWELLLKYRPGRTVILSTHYMDEAELLGDRVAVIARGQLRCCGSPLFLKSRLGVGYYLTLVKRRPTAPTRGGQKGLQEESDSERSWDTGLGSEPSSESTTNTGQLLALVQRLVPGAQLVEELGHELVLVLPYSGARDGAFGRLFQELDGRLAELGVSGYGVSDTTLEEIFLKVAEDSGVTNNLTDGVGQPLRLGVPTPASAHSLKTPSEAADRDSDGNLDQPIPAAAAAAAEVLETQVLRGEPSSGERVQGWALIRQQLRALLIKRFLYACRSRRGLFAQIVLPALFVGLSLFFSLIVPPFGHYPPLQLQLSMYGPQQTFFSEDAPRDLESARLLDALLAESIFGSECPLNNSEPGQNCAQPSPLSFWVPEVSEEVANIFAHGNWTAEFPSPACVCSQPGIRKILPDCPDAAGGLPPPQAERGVGDIVQNLTSRNISDYLLKTYPRIIHQGLRNKKWVNEMRYGGFSLGDHGSARQSSEAEILHTIQELRKLANASQDSALDLLLVHLSSFAKKLGSQKSVKVWFNNKGWHAMVALVNVVNNGLLRAHLPPNISYRAHSITTINHPLNLTKEQLSKATLMASSVDVLVSICVLFAMSFVPASFVLFLIEERVSRAQHLQMLGGLSPSLYWLGNFTWDMCNYLVSALLVVLIFLGFQQRAYVSTANLPALMLLLLLYGWSITPLMYPASFIFHVPSTAYVVLTCINLFIGINGSMATFVLELFSDQKLQEVSRILKKVFLIFPHFCLGRGLIDMVQNQVLADTFLRLGDDQFQSPLRWDLVGKNLFAMGVQGPIFLLFTLLLQYRLRLCPRPRLKPLPPLGEEDKDVAEERERVSRGETGNSVLVLRDLTKVYPGRRKPAVDRLSLMIPRGECFGLLGVNGAGKTSTFRMLTGDTPVSGGEAFLQGFSIVSDVQGAHRYMGYCPQFDALTDLLTGREHLEFFSRLRGIPEEEVAKEAQKGLTKLGLLQYADRPAGGYSGGNKRKLSTAIALVGGPPVLFLDEPTTGMDPQARRFLWNCILTIIKEGRSVVLTSHSMEECEALCTRLAIMVNGRFRCLGSAQHLKNRFGEGYTVALRVPTAHLDQVQDFMEATFPGVLLKEHHGCLLQYQLPIRHCPLAQLFGQLAAHSDPLGIEDFSVSQTTLDQVFVYFAKDQSEDDPDPDHLSRPRFSRTGRLRRAVAESVV